MKGVSLMRRRFIIQAAARVAGGVLIVYAALLVITTVIDMLGPMGLMALRGTVQHSLVGELLLACVLAACFLVIGEHSCHDIKSAIDSIDEGGSEDSQETDVEAKNQQRAAPDTPAPPNGD